MRESPLSQYRAIERAALIEYLALTEMQLDQDAFAEFAERSDHAEILLAMRGGEKYSQMIWRQIGDT